MKWGGQPGRLQPDDAEPRTHALRPSSGVGPLIVPRGSVCMLCGQHGGHSSEKTAALMKAPGSLMRASHALLLSGPRLLPRLSEGVSKRVLTDIALGCPAFFSSHPAALKLILAQHS